MIRTSCASVLALSLALSGLSALAQEEETPHLGGVDVPMEQQFDEEGSKFKDITGDLKRSKRKRGKSPF